MSAKQKSGATDDGKTFDLLCAFCQLQASHFQYASFIRSPNSWKAKEMRIFYAFDFYNKKVNDK